jgi:SAM-dependent methyltransferase
MWLSGADVVYRSFASALVRATPLRLCGLRALDMGAGTGAVSRQLRAAGARPIALDASHAMLRGAGRHLHDLDVVVADALRLPFVAHSFDATFAAFLLNHLSAPHLALVEATRVTRPGGAVMAMTFSAGDQHPVKVAVEDVAARWGWQPPAWYHEQTNWAALTDSVSGLATEARRAGLPTAKISRFEMDVGAFSPGQLVRWRLGHAQLAGWAMALPPGELRRFVAQAKAAVGHRPQLLKREVLVLSSHLPA